MVNETFLPAPDALVLSALAWTLADGDRAHRLLATTGLTPEALREGLHEPAFLAATIRFLAAHEPDLIACAAALEVPPAALVDARRSLEG